MNFTLTQEQYEALIFLARKGAGSNGAKQLELDFFLKDIEKTNGITRSFLWVQWQELSAPVPAGTSFPTKWPPELRRAIEFIARPVAKVDVEQVLEKYAQQPTIVLVTKDPAALVGWTPIDDFFIT
jgi:hypothetical protein